MNKRQIIFMLLSLLMMIGIFVFSSFEGDESGEMSMAAGELLCKIFVPGYEELSEAKQLSLAEQMDYPIRKLAHMAEYALLASLILFALLSDLKSGEFKWYIVALIISILYAVTDEIHQLFVPGRSGRITDVFIDTLGMITGLFICYLVTRWISSSRSCDTHRE